MDGWVDGWMDRWMDGQIERRTDRQTERHRQSDRQVDTQTDIWIDGWIDGQMYGQIDDNGLERQMIDGYLNKQTGRHIDKQMMGSQVDGWTDVRIDIQNVDKDIQRQNQKASRKSNMTKSDALNCVHSTKCTVWQITHYM